MSQPSGVAPEPCSSAATRTLFGRIDWTFASLWFKRINKLSLFFGTALTFFYFIHHRYSPIESLSSIGSVVALVATLAVLMGFSLVLTWGFPALLTNVISNDQELRSMLAWLVEERKDGEASPSPETINPKKLVWLSLGVFTLPWAAVFAYQMPAYFGGASVHGWVSALFSVTAFLCVSPFLLSGTSRSNSIGETAKRAVFVVALIILAAGPMLVFLALANLASIESSNVELVRWLLIAVLLLITASAAINISFALGGKKNTVAEQVLVIILSLTWLVLVLELPGELLNKVMVNASVRLESAQIVLSGEGCQALALYPPRASPPMGSIAETAASCLLSNVQVVSRIGEHWRLGCPGHRQAGIVIAGKHVQGWSSAASGVEPDARVAQICAGLVQGR